MKTWIWLLGMLLCVLGSIRSGSEVAAQASSAELIKRQLRYDQWLTEDHAPAGFEFKRSDFTALAGLDVRSDKTSVALVQWNVDASNYVCAVERAVTLAADDGGSLTIQIRVMPTAARAKESLLLGYEASSAPPAEVRFAGDFGYSIGAAALLRGVADDATELNESDVHSLVFVRRNVVINLSSDDDCEVLLPALAYEIDVKIQSQASTDAGTLRPTIALTVGVSILDTGDAKTGQQFSTTVTHEVTGLPNSATYGKHFFTGSRSSTGYDAQGRLVAVAQPSCFGSTSGLSFDDPASPTKIIVQGSGSRGEYRIGLGAWGPNLLASIESRDFEVK